MIPRKWPDQTAIVCGTGPSITPKIIKTVNDSDCRIFGANRAYEIFNCEVVHGCNWQFWELHYPRIAKLDVEMWTTRKRLEGRFPRLNYIEERWEDGLSKEQHWISAHHGTGPQLVNIAYLYGCTKLILVGWDMRYWGKTGERQYERRRYLPEDELTLNHWPRSGPNGEQEGLIREMETISPDDYGIDIVNCTKGSAMKCFRFGDLADEIAA